MAFTTMPNMRPNVAPIAIEGTNIPAGTLHPYDIMTRPIRTSVASNSELAIRHWASVLYPVRHQTCAHVFRLTGKDCLYSRHLHILETIFPY